MKEVERVQQITEEELNNRLIAFLDDTKSLFGSKEKHGRIFIAPQGFYLSCSSSKQGQLSSFNKSLDEKEYVEHDHNNPFMARGLYFYFNFNDNYLLIDGGTKMYEKHRVAEVRLSNTRDFHNLLIKVVAE